MACLVAGNTIAIQSLAWSLEGSTSRIVHARVS
jgi:hypothetical protein